MPSAFNEKSIEAEALRILAAEQAAQRRAALDRQRHAAQEVAELAARERDARVAAEAERIEIARRAEEAIIAARVRAEKEAYDAAVAAKLAELRARPEMEVLRAELEELRAELRGEVTAVREATPWSAPLQEVRAQVGACPWNSGITGLRTQLDALTASVAEVKGLVKKPARQVCVWFSSSLCGGPVNPATGLHPQVQRLTITYHLIPQHTYAAPGGRGTGMCVDDNSGATIQVPEGHKVFVVSASAADLHGRGPRDMTFHYKGLLESQ